MKVEFKSNPEMYLKELAGVKPNTLRKVNCSDTRFKILDDYEKGVFTELDIVIRKSETSEYFTCRVTDVTFWEGWCIISWNHK